MGSREKGGAAAVAFEHVSKQFGDAIAVDDVNLAIAEGMFVTIIGSSGCGKTTLLKMVNALVMPDEGEVLVHGRATSNADPIGPRRNIGYAIQGSVLFPHLTVEQNIAYVPSLLNRRDQRRTESAVDKWIGLLGLPSNLRDRYPAELSGGQAQRVGIARALAASPDILLSAPWMLSHAQACRTKSSASTTRPASPPCSSRTISTKHLTWVKK